MYKSFHEMDSLSVKKLINLNSIKTILTTLMACC